MTHSEAWYATNAARCAAIIAYCDNPFDDTENAMRDACSVRQASLFDLSGAGVMAIEADQARRIGVMK